MDGKRAGDRACGSLEDSRRGEGPVSPAPPSLHPLRALGCLVGVECSIS